MTCYNRVMKPLHNHLAQAACLVLMHPTEPLICTTTRRNGTLLGLPGGKMDPGESMAQTAIRETAEEVGVSVDPTTMEPLFSAMIVGDKDFWVETFVATSPTAEIQQMESGIKVQWSTWEDFLSNNAFPMYNNAVYEAWIALEARRAMYTRKTTLSGDLLALANQGHFDVIVQGCNCFCTMGKGIALDIKKMYPEVYAADRATKYGDPGKMGTYSQATVETPAGPLTIVNGYTQFDFRGSGVKADYNAIRAVFKAIKEEFSGARIGYPMIGAGLAGGDWPTIEAIINEELAGEQHTQVIFVPPYLAQNGPVGP